MSSTKDESARPSLAPFCFQHLLPFSIPPRTQRDRQASTEKQSTSYCQVELWCWVPARSALRTHHRPALPYRGAQTRRSGLAHPSRQAPSRDDDFRDMTPKAQAIKTQVDKWGHIKRKGFCAAKETINRIRRQPTEWEKTLANHMSDKG